METKRFPKWVEKKIEEIKKQKKKEADLELLFEGVSIQFEPGVILTKEEQEQILEFVIDPVSFAKKCEPLGGEDDWPKNRDRII